ncbi:MAG: YjgN family protein [Methylophagaceae bacterium]
MDADNLGIERQIIPFEFTGKGFEYFKIWIVNICLTVLTLGVYSAWAKVRTNSYFYGNTILDNSHFSYLADPMNILKGRLVALGIFIVYWLAWQFYPQAGIALIAIACFLFPFFLVSTMAFRMRNSAYRNIRFHFTKDLKGAYMAFLLPLGLLVLVTWLIYQAVDMSGVLDAMVDSSQEEGEIVQKEDFILSAFMLALIPVIPWLDYLRTRFIIKQIQYGKAQANFNSGAWGFYKVYFVTFIAFVLVGLLFGVAMVAFFQSIGDVFADNMTVLLPVFMVVFYTITFFISGLWRAMHRNMIYGNTKIGDNQLHSHLKGMTIGWIYLSNTIAIIISVGMLIPWAKVRMARYVASCTELVVNDLASIRTMKQEDSNAFGEEMGEMFDLDLGM